MKKSTLFSLALVAGLAMSPSFADAQTKVTLTTGKAVGAEMSFATNPGKLSIDWGDGKVVEVSTNGEPVKGTLKGQTVTVSCNNLWFFDCSSNELTGLEFADALNLKTLYCSDNKLTSMTLSSVRNLEDFDCSANELASLGMTLLRNLKSLNCADNKLATLSLSSQENLKTLICSGNSLSSLGTSSLSNLETLWCQDNELTSLNLNSNPKLQSLVCDNNKVSSVSASNCTALVDFWCDNNELKSLDVQKSVGLQTLSCSNNQLSQLNIPAATSTNKALAFYCDGNNLTFSSMHSPENILNDKNVLFGPQNKFALPKSKVLVGEQLILDGFEKNVDGDNLYADYVWKNGDAELVKGSKDDYTERSGLFKFNKPFTSIFCEVTTSNYPGLTLTSEPLDVVTEETGIEDIMASYGFSYVTNNGTIDMKSDKPYRVNIYTVDGKQVWTGVVNGEERVSLGHGLFLVNGLKVTL